MNAEDFRRIALSLEGAEEGAHMGSPDFRVGGRIFATLASQSQGYGNLMLTPEQQAAFVQELPEVFVPIAGGWGRMGMTIFALQRRTRMCCSARCTRPGSYGLRRTRDQRVRSEPRRRGSEQQRAVAGNDEDPTSYARQSGKMPAPFGIAPAPPPSVQAS
jgi:hypothetical protein